jgi:hypothetical protein
LDEIGTLGEAAATQPGALERQYVPTSNKILLASRLLQPRDAQKLAFTAPAKPGVYPYVCTYPGHWRRMYGALYVVDDLDAYLENPEIYLASHPLEIKDAQLIFDAVWQDLEADVGREKLRFPKEIILLGGAPGAGKGTNTAFIVDTNKNVVDQFLQAMNKIRGAVIGCARGFVFGIVPGFNRAPFNVPLATTGATYRLTVTQFEWRDLGGGGGM